MYSPKEQQIEICLLKSNLEAIEKDLVLQRSTLPALDVENEQQYRESMIALKVARAVNSEIELLKQENVRLTAKRVQIRKQCEELGERLNRAWDVRELTTKAIDYEEKEEECMIRTYEDSLFEKAERFRKSRCFYDENEIKEKFNNVTSLNLELEVKTAKIKDLLNGLKQELNCLHEDVPENILEIIDISLCLDRFKSKQEEHLERLEDKLIKLQKKLDHLKLLK